MTRRGSWPHDTRGIVDPEAMQRVVDFARYPAGTDLAGIIDWFWSVSWSLPDDFVHSQQVLNHPSGHVSIGTLDESEVPLRPARGRVYGVLTGISTRRLSAEGWTVAAKTTVGGLGVLIDRAAREIVDTELDLASREPPTLPGVDGGALVADVRGLDAIEARVDRLRDGLTSAVNRRSADRVAEARQVADVAELAEQDRTVCRTEDLAEAANVSVRTLQRLFDTHVGVSPSWVIRRWRIIEAAEAAASWATSHGSVDGGINDSADGDAESRLGWAALSDRLGYADQSHLIRDFKRHLGATPLEYVDRNRA